MRHDFAALIAYPVTMSSQADPPSSQPAPAVGLPPQLKGSHAAIFHLLRQGKAAPPAPQKPAPAAVRMPVVAPVRPGPAARPDRRLMPSGALAHIFVLEDQFRFVSA